MILRKYFSGLNSCLAGSLYRLDTSRTTSGAKLPGASGRPKIRPCQEKDADFRRSDCSSLGFGPVKGIVQITGKVEVYFRSAVVGRDWLPHEEPRTAPGELLPPILASHPGEGKFLPGDVTHNFDTVKPY